MADYWKPWRDAVEGCLHVVLTLATPHWIVPLFALVPPFPVASPAPLTDPSSPEHPFDADKPSRRQLSVVARFVEIVASAFPGYRQFVAPFYLESGSIVAGFQRRALQLPDVLSPLARRVPPDRLSCALESLRIVVAGGRVALGVVAPVVVGKPVELVAADS